MKVPGARRSAGSALGTGSEGIRAGRAAGAGWCVAGAGSADDRAKGAECARSGAECAGRGGNGAWCAGRGELGAAKAGNAVVRAKGAVFVSKFNPRRKTANPRCGWVGAHTSKKVWVALETELTSRLHNAHVVEEKRFGEVIRHRLTQQVPGERRRDQENEGG